MSTDPVHPLTSAVGTNTKPKTHSTVPVDDPSLPPQRYASAVGLGPNYPLGSVSQLRTPVRLRHGLVVFWLSPAYEHHKGLGDKLEGIAEEIKWKVLGKPELVEQGCRCRTGERMRNEHERDNAANPFEVEQK